MMGSGRRRCRRSDQAMELRGVDGEVAGNRQQSATDAGALVAIEQKSTTIVIRRFFSGLEGRNLPVIRCLPSKLTYKYICMLCVRTRLVESYGWIGAKVVRA
jgi:hypothetical protein